MVTHAHIQLPIILLKKGFFCMVRGSYVPYLVKIVHEWRRRHNIVHRRRTDGRTDTRSDFIVCPMLCHALHWTDKNCEVYNNTVRVTCCLEIIKLQTTLFSTLKNFNFTITRRILLSIWQGWVWGQHFQGQGQWSSRPMPRFHFFVLSSSCPWGRGLSSTTPWSHRWCVMVKLEFCNVKKWSLQFYTLQAPDYP